MVMRKFKDILESDKYDIVKEKLYHLFLDLWKENLEIENVHIGYFNDPNDWELRCDFNVAFTNDSYKYLKQILNIIEKFNLEFRLTTSGSNSWRIKVSLKNKFNEFIDEMEILNNLKKYNM